MAKPSLSDLLEGNTSPPPDDAPIHRLERPSYQRAGLYGRTPFKLRTAEIVAVTTEQLCQSCGSSHLGFGGIFREFQGNDATGELTLRSAITNVLKDQIERVVHTTEPVPFCPTCLGKGDSVGAPAHQGHGEGVASFPTPPMERQ